MAAQESRRETKGVSVNTRAGEKNGTINAKICMSSAGKVTIGKKWND